MKSSYLNVIFLSLNSAGMIRHLSTIFESDLVAGELAGAALLMASACCSRSSAVLSIMAVSGIIVASDMMEDGTLRPAMYPVLLSTPFTSYRP